MRCVFPTASWAVAESGVVAAGQRLSCALKARSWTSVRLRGIADGVSAILAPGSCRLCYASLVRAADYPVCDRCLESLASRPLECVCSLCSEPLGFESALAADLSRTASAICAACRRQEPAFVRAVAFGLYDDLRPAIHLLKFEGIPALAQPLGSLLAEAMLLLQPTSPSALTVVAVPLFRGKRRYNQSVLLAKSALKTLRVKAPEWKLRLGQGVLIRTRKTHSQFLLSPAQRRQNIQGAFAVRGDVSGQDILLVDDVYTTGATVAECTSVLLRAGAGSVRVVTLGRAGRDTAVSWQPEGKARAGPHRTLTDELPVRLAGIQ